MLDPARRFPSDFRLYLASQSPRRHSLLREIGVPYEVVATHGEEESTGRQPALVAEQNAVRKAKGAVLPSDAPRGAFVLGTDTVVAVDGMILGKPRSQEEARDMLTTLQGRTHQVVSGVALLRVPGSGGGRNAALGSGSDPGRADLQSRRSGEAQIWVDHALTRVTFRPLESEDIAAYITSREWVGKAGGYAIQGLAGLFAESIEGEYSNVVGLPLCLLRELFRRAGFDLLRGRWV